MDRRAGLSFEKNVMDTLLGEQDGTDEAQWTASNDGKSGIAWYHRHGSCIWRNLLLACQIQLRLLMHLASSKPHINGNLENLARDIKILAPRW